MLTTTENGDVASSTVQAKAQKTDGRDSEHPQSVGEPRDRSEPEEAGADHEEAGYGHGV